MAVPELSYQFKSIPPRAITSREKEWSNRRNKLDAAGEYRHEIELTANKDGAEEGQ